VNLRSRPQAERPPVKLVAWRSPAAALDDHQAAGFDRAKKSFLAAISHELRTPLNAIIGFAEIMDAQILGPIETPEYREYIRDIGTTGRHLLRIVEDVLDISQAEAGELVMAKREVDSGELIRRSLASFDAACLARKIRIVTELPEDLIVQVDPARVERAVTCLLSNAIKFSRDSGQVEVRAAFGADGQIRIAIRDHGIGMPPAAIERAFAPFVQLQDKLSRPYEGAGLGLPLARLLAELHGGRVLIDSLPGEGTIATLELPAYSRQFEDQRRADQSQKIAKVSGRRPAPAAVP
jgi:two-component system cell cycle sensor histidine kinase PleC